MGGARPARARLATLGLPRVPSFLMQSALILRFVFIYVHEGVGIVHVCMCAGVQGGQEKASDPLELELHVVVSLLTPVQGSENSKLS